MVNRYLEAVKEFHDAFDVPTPNQVNISDIQLNALRVSLIKEELNELSGGLLEGNPVEVLDALLDLQYVVSGAVLVFGFSGVFDAAFEEVHSSNMSKLGDDGKPIYRKDGKVLKGPDFREPELGRFVLEANNGVFVGVDLAAVGTHSYTVNVDVDTDRGYQKRKIAANPQPPLAPDPYDDPVK